MNKRNLALLISKHPLLRKLTEDKTIPNSVVARLIVEELMEQPEQLKLPFDDNEKKQDTDTEKQKKPELSKVKPDLLKILDTAISKNGDDELKEIYQKFLEILETGDSSKINFDGVLSKANSAVSAKKIKSAKDILNKAIEAMAGQQQPQQDGDSQLKPILDKFANFLKNSGVLGENIEALIKALQPKDKKVFGDSFGKNFKQNEINALKQYFEKKENIVLFVKQYFGNNPEKDQILQNVEKVLSGQPLGQDQQENPYKDMPGYKELNLNPEQENVFVSFLNKLKEQKIIKEGNLRGLNKILGTESQKLADIIKSYEKPQMDILIKLLKRDDVQAFIQKNLSNITKQEPGKKEKPVAIKPEKTKAFVDAANQFINEFYNQKYRIEQGRLVANVINAMKEFTEPKDMAVAFARVPTEEPDTKKPIEEQEGQKVKADDDEMRNIRIGLRSFLRRVNKTKEFLTEFQEVAKEGSVLSDSYKKRFIDNLKQIQTAIYRIAIVLNNILGDKEELNEKKESEVMQKMKEVQKLYDLSEKSVGAIKDLLDTETPPKELDSDLTNDAYSALSSLAGHFPSVAPFGSSEGSKADFVGYKLKFDNAISRVKSDLQNVFNLIKTGQSGEESLQNARDGLSTFGDEIASIFGVPSKFKDAKVQPGDDKEPAVQEDPEAKKEPPKEEGFLGQLGTIITDSILSFLGNRISSGSKKEKIVTDIESLNQLDEKTKQILSGVVKQYGLTELQKTARMTSGEMQLYIQLLVVLEKKGDIKLKLDEIVVADNIKQAIESNFEEQEQETLMNILKKDGVYPHLLSLGTDDFGEEGFETFDDDPKDPEEKINSILKKEFKLENLQKQSGMSDKQVRLYARLLVALDKDGVVKLEEAKPDEAFMMNVKKVIEDPKYEFSKKENEDILEILKLNGVKAHLKSVYIGDAVEVEGDLDDDSGGGDREIFDYLTSDLEEIESPKKQKSEKEKKKSPTQADIRDMALTGSGLFTEQLIADKLKPLIREMLNKGK